MNDDPTLVRNQPALTTASGTNWLIIGGLFTVISVATLLALAPLPPSGLAGGAIAAVVTLYVSMVIVRVAVRARKLRLRLIAALFLINAFISLSAVVAIAAVSWDGL